MSSQYFCTGMDQRDGSFHLHEQEDAGNCERCGSDLMFPIRLYGLRSAMDGALEAASYSKDDHVMFAMKRVHEAFENVLYELKRIGDEIESLKN